MEVKSGERHEYTKKFACKKFTCQVCGPHVRLRFMAQVLQGMDGAEQCSLLTLTIRRYNSVSNLNKNWNKWVKRIKRRLDCPKCKDSFEFVKVLEYQLNGNPHIHAILNKPVSYFKTKRVKEWNPRKRRNEFWVAQDDWLLKHWQEANQDGYIKKIALNPIPSGKDVAVSAAAEIAKYLSKAKSKKSDHKRWYSFSRRFRGCRPKLGILASTYYHDKRGDCDDPYSNTCVCQRSVISWNFRDFGNVFINYDLMKMMIGGQ